jgi:hypothetical protein
MATAGVSRQPDRQGQPPGVCLPDLVLGGAVVTRGQWRARLLIRFYTSLFGAPDPCHAQSSDELVPEEAVIIVGCLNGGSDGESFVIVLGFHPGVGLPQILLSADCGDTNWQIHGASLTIISSDLKEGAAFPGAPHPDISFTWQGNGAYGSFGETSNDGFNSFQSYCHALDPSNT